MDIECKTELFKLLHLSLVIYDPDPHSTSVIRGRTPDHLSEDRLKVWHQYLRNIFGIVDSEIKGLNKHTNRAQTTICPIFVRMAARGCAVVSYYAFYY